MFAMKMLPSGRAYDALWFSLKAAEKAEAAWKLTVERLADLAG